MLIANNFILLYQAARILYIYYNNYDKIYDIGHDNIMIINDLSTLLWFNRLPEDLLWQSISSPLSEHYREEMECQFVICINNQHPKLKYVRPIMLCTSDGLPWFNSVSCIHIVEATTL